jgi:hypothetical protein
MAMGQAHIEERLKYFKDGITSNVEKT